ncbi:MAG: arylsulfatase [Fermentimonas sp.]|jgi:arylsulfatase A-like enzyme|nr:arylsulfatase [Fermentimonas sp.]MDD4008434.1 arylsulfatase [Fermentimonas sp.]MDD4696805.1 arylsulfatase [Fermentimonas sp.]
MSKNKIVTTAIGLAAFTSFYAQDRPNVVFIITDDLGYGDLSCYGQEKFETPNIDRLALNGTRFTRSYSGTTVSAPSRASLLTGLHTGNAPIRGNREIQPEGQAPLPADSYTLFRLFKESGYTTGAFGKWGLGYPGSAGDPVNQGVDHFFGYNCQRLAHNYYPSHLWNNETKVELPENDNGKFGIYSQDLIQKKTLEFIEKQKENPFFMYVPIVLPHAELVIPEDSIIHELRGKFPETPFRGTDSGPQFRKGGYMSQDYPRATHAAMVKRIDIYVAQIIDKLKEEGLYDNTLIIFTSDNGPHREGGGDPDFFNSNSIYRGYKRDLYEGGIRVPTIISWQGKVAAGAENNFPFAFWDYLPTFAEILEVEPETKTNGVSILPTLLGNDGQKERDYFYFEFQESGGRQAIIKEDWKLLHLDIRNGGIYELYNIASDPSENHNLITLYPEKAEELKEIMKNARTDDPNWPLF